jgi:deoxycytidylate deaminase
MHSDDKITYPFMPKGGEIRYVDGSNEYLLEAKRIAGEQSLDKVMPNASVVVKDGKIIGSGANGSNYHETHVCERVRLNMPTGEGYELCEGCHPKNHSEPRAIQDALSRGNDPKGAELYLWGHWWCCEPCWDSMLGNGINTVYLLKNSEILFNKTAQGNVVGKQFKLA